MDTVVGRRGFPVSTRVRVQLLKTGGIEILGEYIEKKSLFVVERELDYFFSSLRMAILAAARRATGMRKGLQLT
jgi:hypothetical protein